MPKFLSLLSLLGLLLLATACGGAEPEVVTLRLMTHDSFEISAETLEAFTAETGHTVEIFKAGDAGAMVNQAILSKDAPLADVLFGVDNTFLSRALDNEIFIPYQSPELDQIDDQLEIDPQYRVSPVSFGDVCLNYDIGWFAAEGLAPPSSLEDLLDPSYAGLTVVQNPATSSPGLAFLMATVSAFGEDGYLAYWEGLVDNDVLVTNGWEDAYWGQFSGASDGERPIVVSYASSPPAEVFYSEGAYTEAPTAAVTAPQSCFRQIEFVGILDGTEHAEAAQELIDFMLSRTFQEDMPLNMFIYPANTTAQLPELFVSFSATPAEPATLDPQTIATQREAWIAGWTDTVLR